MSGDTFKRRFDGDVAQCGCRWQRVAGLGDVLTECPIHAAAGKVRYERFERERCAALQQKEGNRG